MYTRWLPLINSKKVILASGSAQRIKLLDGLGIKFESIPSDFPENLDKCSPKDYVEKTCAKKFEEFLNKYSSPDTLKYDILITGDTIVVHDGVILEKPTDEKDINVWLMKYSNSLVVCYTSVVIGIIDSSSNKNQIIKSTQFTAETVVYFDEITEGMISDYLKNGDYMGKAGGFSIQGNAQTLIKKIDGCYYNVVGFPVYDFTSHLIKLLKAVYGENGWII